MHFSSFLKDKIVVITGGSDGIGKALAKESVKRGAKVALMARREPLLRTVQEELGEDRCAIYPGDVRDRETVRKMVEDVEKRWGKVDIAIANAGVGTLFPKGKWDPEKVEEVFAINLLGTVHLISAVLPGMKERRGGHIVGIGSLAGLRGLPGGSSVYSASKAAMITLLEGLAVDLKPFGIRVTTVNPGFVDTPMTQKNTFPMPFMVSVEKASKKILNGIEKGKRYIEFPFPLVVGTHLLKFLPSSI